MYLLSLTERQRARERERDRDRNQERNTERRKEGKKERESGERETEGKSERQRERAHLHFGCAFLVLPCLQPEGNALAADWSVWLVVMRRGGKLLTKRNFRTPTGKPLQTGHFGTWGMTSGPGKVLFPNPCRRRRRRRARARERERERESLRDVQTTGFAWVDLRVRWGRVCAGPHPPEEEEEEGRRKTISRRPRKSRSRRKGGGGGEGERKAKGRCDWPPAPRHPLTSNGPEFDFASDQGTPLSLMLGVVRGFVRDLQALCHTFVRPLLLGGLGQWRSV